MNNFQKNARLAIKFIFVGRDNQRPLRAPSLDLGLLALTIRNRMRVAQFVFAVLLFSAGFTQAALVNGINAVVNDTVITYDQVERGIASFAEGIFRQYRNQPQVLEEKMKGLRANQIEELVERQLILNEFKTAGYKLPETFIDDAIRDEIRKKDRKSTRLNSSHG